MKSAPRFLPLLILALLGLAPLAASAATQPAITLRFDHTTTGFELDGAHRDLPCESCHINAVFKGTPRDCAACHSRGTRFNATPKPANHILSSEHCAACHTTTAYLPAVHFDHADVRGSCASCHNNVQAAGKPPGHIQTSEPCETCHSTAAWLPAAFDHAGITSNCISCHNGQRATGKGTSHLATGDNCEACHSTNYWQPALRVDHSQVSGACVSCHSGSVSISTGSVTGKSAHHIPADNSCDSCQCRRRAGRRSRSLTRDSRPLRQLPRRHAGASGQEQRAPADHEQLRELPRHQHWKPAVAVDHAQVVGNCLGCHNGTSSISTGPVTAKPANHIPSSSNCENCHTTSAWKPANFNHNNVTGSCVSCHNGTDGDRQDADAHGDQQFLRELPQRRRLEACGSRRSHAGHRHLLFLPRRRAHDQHRHRDHEGRDPHRQHHGCESCHVTVAWKPVTNVDHNQVTGTCLSCHSGTVAISTGIIAGKPATSPADNNCQNCHTTAAWQPANFNHNGITGNCVSCHNGTTATGKNATHIASSNTCDSCHNTVAWRPTDRVDHAQVPAAVSGSCISCHNGSLTISTGVVTAKPADAIHQNVTQECSTATRRSRGSPRTSSIPASPATAAAATTALRPPARRQRTSRPAIRCESCHSAVAWKPATRVDHAQVSGTCLSCHNGSVAISTGTVTGKTATHIASSNTCQNCHGTIAWKPATRVDHGGHRQLRQLPQRRAVDQYRHGDGQAGDAHRQQQHLRELPRHDDLEAGDQRGPHTGHAAAASPATTARW